MTVYIQDNIFLDTHAEAQPSLPLEAYNYGLTYPGMRMSEDNCSPVNSLFCAYMCNGCSFKQASGS